MTHNRSSSATMSRLIRLAFVAVLQFAALCFSKQDGAAAEESCRDVYQGYYKANEVGNQYYLAADRQDKTTARDLWRQFTAMYLSTPDVPFACDTQTTGLENRANTLYAVGIYGRGIRTSPHALSEAVGRLTDYFCYDRDFIIKGDWDSHPSAVALIQKFYIRLVGYARRDHIDGDEIGLGILRDELGAESLLPIDSMAEPEMPPGVE